MATERQKQKQQKQQQKRMKCSYINAIDAANHCHLKCLGMYAKASRTKIPSSSMAFTWSSLHWAFVALFVVALCGGLLPVSDQTKQKFCGKSLTEAMDLVCVNGYNDKISSSAPAPAPAAAEKRKANEFSVSKVNKAKEYASEPTLFLLNTYALSPFVGAVYANILANGRRRRNGGGVYNECCRKACSYAELAAYCRPPN